ncbi:tetratricopeptide repeat protein [Actinoallomurus spadix]|uniref:Tetratricopeptide repeat protein n=1 Tax=Actinoallomurus spadix TaxID=79912 RepID=A0ABP3H297_9ACTN|nr:tetratricopeptide repeat protein [Actinoallomurus spadix]MCO5987740.1 tetratricopeptide repeat protein [Actinoallomurus spadix]
MYDEARHKSEAIRWYQAAADQGATDAMINLAFLLEDDDREAALRWTRQAVALSPDLTARYNLGAFLEEDGLLEEAEQRYRMAAQVNFPAARNRLACLLKGTGRLEEAEAWYRRALDERTESCDTAGDDDYTANTTIMYNLAGLLEETGRPQEALGLYRHAAERGDADAGQDVARLELR